MDAGQHESSGQSLSIGALARAAGIPVGTLRTWERRYGFPCPERRPSGHRLYPLSAVEHLRRVGRLLAEGHRPREVLGLSVAELDTLLGLVSPPTAPTEEPAARREMGLGTVDLAVREMLQATVEFDRAALLQALRAAWVRFGPLRFLQEVAGEFMVEVGRAWKARSIEIRHEHFASACLSDFLRAAREPYDQRARGPRIVTAMLPGDGHEGGVLMVSALLAMRGWRVLYLGAGTPIEQIAATARTTSAQVVALSVSAAVPLAVASRSIAQLRAALPSRLALWIGGAGAPRPARGVERFGSLSDLDTRLTAAS